MLCVIVFSPPRFYTDISAFYKALDLPEFDTAYYTVKSAPADAESKQALKLAGKADMLIIGSFQWSDESSVRQIKLIKKLFALQKPSILASLMSPYDIEKFPEAGTVLATYGITKISMKTMGEIIIGREKPLGKLPVKLNIR